MNDQDYRVVAAMQLYGGSFVVSLAKAFQTADSANFDRLKAAFPDFWAEYTELAEMRLKKRGNPPKTTKKPGTP